MTIETLQKRIEGKEKEVEKLSKKLERIHKAKESNWENNPYWYSEYDLGHTERELEAANKSLNDYKGQLLCEQEKANSRNIKPILEFLDRWKDRVRQYHIDCVPDYLKARDEFYALDKAHSEWWNSGGFHAPKEEYKQRKDELNHARKEYRAAWNWLIDYMDRDKLDLEKLNKALDREANAKYDDIIERTNHITGTITDASNLHIGRKGDLNGFIEGERGKAKVETIGAGGYNIQCYHFRTLIHELKTQEKEEIDEDLEL